MQDVKELLLKRSSKGMVTNAVITVVGATVALYIGILVISNVQGSISQSGWTAQANTTYTSVQTTVWNSIQLLSVGLIVMAAVVILAYFTVGRSGGAE